ncbi:AAA family ATPase [Streptosporangium sandarakinum]
MSVPLKNQTLRYPARSLVILTGLPGAGKTILLSRLYGLDAAASDPVVVGGTVVIDTHQSRNRWAGRLPSAPARVRRAVVFATHFWRIGRSVARGYPVIAHNRGCGPLVLYGFALLARRAGARLHLLMLDVAPETALAGQRARGRVVDEVTFDRHRRRWEALVGRVRAGRPVPASGATVIDRSVASRLRSIDFG